MKVVLRIDWPSNPLELYPSRLIIRYEGIEKHLFC